MSDRKNIAELMHGGFLIGWTYQQDGDWMASTNTECRTKFGPFVSEENAQDALLGVVTMHYGSIARRTFALISITNRRDADDLMGYQASGSTTWFSEDSPAGQVVRWHIEDGQACINALSGVGSPANGEAKAWAILEATGSAATALASIAKAAA